MAKYVCTVCGYVHEGDEAPEKCPQCGVPASKFKKQEGEMSWAAEHVLGVAQGVDDEIAVLGALYEHLTVLKANNYCFGGGFYIAEFVFQTAAADILKHIYNLLFALFE